MIMLSKNLILFIINNQINRFIEKLMNDKRKFKLLYNE